MRASVCDVFMFMSMYKNNNWFILFIIIIIGRHRSNLNIQ